MTTNRTRGHARRNERLAAGFRRVRSSDVPLEIRGFAIEFLLTKPKRGQTRLATDNAGRAWALLAETHSDETRGDHLGVSALLSRTI